jgi:hypothetical protein
MAEEASIMWRDPLDELIADLERIVPATAPRTGFDPLTLCMEADRLDREFALERAQQHPRVEAAAPTVSIAPTKPVRRLDPSAPVWNAAADTPDTDPDDSGG